MREVDLACRAECSFAQAQLNVRPHVGATSRHIGVTPAPTKTAEAKAAAAAAEQIAEAEQRLDELREVVEQEALLAERGKTPDQSDLAEMDPLWNQAKIDEKAKEK